jgi:hypothetical protein
MVDPITAIASAKMAYEAIKKGLQIGKDIESMAGDLSMMLRKVMRKLKDAGLVL